MNLWVRTQDKECLTNISNIQYVYKNNIHGLGTYYDNLKILGTYKTKERALEVLDEIEEYITPTLGLLDDTLNGKQICQVGNILSMVYQMPKD